jgi:endonuclease-3
MYNSYRMKTGDIEQTIELLIREHGNREWQPRQDPISVLIQTILSQNTSDMNSKRAFDSLMHSFNTWNNVTGASVEEIAYSIRAGGLGEIKARYIKKVLEEIRRERSELALDFLKQLPLDEARDWLRQLPGVGMKTASCVLLFSWNKPALPVDTHVFRVAKRLELIDFKASIEQAHRLLESVVPHDAVYRFHVLFIEHGRKVCKAQRPRCRQCILKETCPSYEILSRLN